MKKLNLADIQVSTVMQRARRPLLLGGLAVLTLGGTTLTSCSDPAQCTDADVGADPAARYDVGSGADPSDFGQGTDADRGSGDPVNGGIRCVDAD